MENELKQKQIEEMEKDIAIRMAGAKSVAGSMNNGVEGWIGKYLIEKGWAKIPENAVVLTGTEVEERFVDLLIEFDEMGFEPTTLCPNAEEYAKKWKRKMLFAIGQLRKETAEKFAERVKMAFYYEFDELIPSIMSDKIGEIAKEITGGEKEISNETV